MYVRAVQLVVQSCDGRPTSNAIRNASVFVQWSWARFGSLFWIPVARRCLFVFIKVCHLFLPSVVKTTRCNRIILRAGGWKPSGTVSYPENYPNETLANHHIWTATVVDTTCHWIQTRTVASLGRHAHIIYTSVLFFKTAACFESMWSKRGFLFHDEISSGCSKYLFVPWFGNLISKRRCQRV